MWSYDLLSLALDKSSPLCLRDRLLVPIVSTFAPPLQGYDPEIIVAAIATTVGTLLLSFANLCFKRALVKHAFSLLAILCFLGAAYASLHLEIDATDLDTGIGYGALPINKAEDFPVLPDISRLYTHRGEYFSDEFNRTLMLRGVNLGGDSKLPTQPNGETWNGNDFFETKEVSFVGRPFPLAEANEHLGRLSAWGFTFIRLIITWEAVEHEGPTIYDTEYLEYLVNVIRKCREFNISVLVDPHQDVWSRWTGGDGAPAWTLEKVGFNIRNLFDTGAALTHQQHGDPFPQMMWPTNNNRLATATMFTLFFAGNLYAPSLKIDDIPVQEYLQSHYIGMLEVVASYVKDEPNVLGYDTMNEPSNGYVGMDSLDKALFAAPLGLFMTGFEGMMLGHGFSLSLPFFSSPMVFQEMKLVNGKGMLAWKSKDHDVWKNEGVWEFDSSGKPQLLRPGHFAFNEKGEPVNFLEDFMAPFFEKIKKAIIDIHPAAIVFAEPYIDPVQPQHNPAPKGLNGNQYAWAPHYYDGLTLILKKARPWIALSILHESIVFGADSAQRSIAEDLKHVKETGTTLGGASLVKRTKDEKLGDGAPVLIGESGIAIDLDRDENGFGTAYKSGDFTSQIYALDRTMKALESNLLSFTLWCYTATNNNKRGDLWNDEDLSLFSRDQQTQTIEKNLHSGGRVLAAAVRPYPMKTCGEPVKLEFDALGDKREFKYTFITYKGDESFMFVHHFAKHRVCNPEVAPTIIYVPNYQYPNGVDVIVTDGHYHHDVKNQFISYSHSTVAGEHSITIVAK